MNTESAHPGSDEPLTGLDADTAVGSDSVGLLEGICTTRAIRRYRDEPVPDHVLRDILFAATRAPSGSNRQPFRFLVLTDGPKAVAPERLLADRRPRGLGGQADGRPLRPGVRGRRRFAEGRHGPDHGRLCRAPRDRAGADPALPGPLPRRPIPAEGASVYPACQNLLLAARALGYGGVMTSLECDRRRRAPRRCWSIPEDVFVAATITLGRPRGRHGPVRRRPLGELVFLDEWGGPAPFAIDPPGTRHTSAGPPPLSEDQLRP